MKLIIVWSEAYKFSSVTCTPILSMAEGLSS